MHGREKACKFLTGSRASGGPRDLIASLSDQSDKMRDPHLLAMVLSQCDSNPGRYRSWLTGNRVFDAILRLLVTERWATKIQTSRLRLARVVNPHPPGRRECASHGAVSLNVRNLHLILEILTSCNVTTRTLIRALLSGHAMVLGCAHQSPSSWLCPLVRPDTIEPPFARLVRRPEMM
jgi:hypothetical protein